MQNTNLLGQTVRFSSRSGKYDGLVTRQLTITHEVFDANDGKRYYRVRDVDSKEEFFALADKYDEYFLTNQSMIKPKNHRDVIQNKSQLGL